VQPSIHREHKPLADTTLLERFAVLVASFAFGLCRFIFLPSPFFN
jgi:hypothetical protein